MEEMFYKFIDEGKREYKEMRAFIYDFQTTNKILFKERNNLLIELRFGVQELLKVINNTPTIDCEVKGVTTRGGKTTTQDAQNNDDNEKEEAQQKKFLENLKQLHINLPFIEALAQMPKYAKFLKGLLTNKARLEEAYMITMNERFRYLGICPKNSKEYIYFRKDRFLDKPLNYDCRYLLKKITLRVGDDEVIFDVDQSIKRPPTEDDECYGIDDLDDTINVEAQELLANEEPDSFLSRGLENNLIRRNLPRMGLLEKRKGAIAWKMSNIKGISPSYCTQKILIEDDFKPFIPPQRRLNPKVQDVVKNEIVKLLDSGLIYSISDSSWDGENEYYFFLEDFSGLIPNSNSTPKIKKRQHLPVLMGLLLTEECLLGYAKL
ncbi:hypothetical protein Tco_1134972 [Tanacetum coccineum]